MTVLKIVIQEMCTIGTHWNADNLLENFPRKNQEVIVYQKTDSQILMSSITGILILKGII